MFFVVRLLVAFPPFQRQNPLFTLQRTWQICDGKHCHMTDRCEIYCNGNRTGKQRQAMNL